MDNPCLKCGVGWGILDYGGAKLCQDTCPKYKAWKREPVKCA